MGDRLKNIKGFFSKQVTDIKFKLAGSGRRLNDESKENENIPTTESEPRVQPSREAQKAGQAALSRFASTSSSHCVSVKKQIKESHSLPKIQNNEDKPSQGDAARKAEEPKETLVCFQCPLIGPEVLPYDEWMVKIKEYLEELILREGSNPCYLAVLIKSVNEPAKANFVCEKLKLCLQNILDHPEEEKFKKIKASNPLFKDKLLPIYGCEQFLLLCGFDYVVIDDVNFLIFQPANSDLEVLKTFIEALNIAEPIQLILDRNTRIVHAPKRQNSKETDEFFNLTTEEVKLEAAKRHEEIEDMKILKTQLMKKKASNFNYDVIEYALIKIKFPDGMYLQGTFKVSETINDVRQFVKEHLKTKNESFKLFTGLGRNVPEPEKTLFEEKLIPSSLLYFEWDKQVSSEDYGYLNEEMASMYC